ncbi:MAG: hypothetical protein CL917_01700 [Deltaproteobacteria bacterium]|nr:hypothetical protein [Deltaproteobacteria bacterium]
MSNSESLTVGNEGSLDGGLNGDYDLHVGSVLREAWSKLDGAKFPLLAATISYGLILAGLGIIINIALVALGEQENTWVEAVGHSVPGFLCLPLAAGIWAMGLRQSCGADVPFKTLFAYFHLLLPILGMMILFYVFVLVGFALLVIPGVYLLISYIFALPLILDKGLGPFEALETSRKALHSHWFQALGIFLSLMLLNLMGGALAGIGLIWTVPLSILTQSVMYRRVFGVESRTLSG